MNDVEDTFVTAYAATPVLHGEPIHIRELTFRYGSRRPVIDMLSFDIKPACHTVIAGPNGCGKSTLAKLFLRLYEPEHGLIKIGDFDLRDIDLTYLRHRIGYVPQRGSLLSGTVIDNEAVAQHGETRVERVARRE